MIQMLAALLNKEDIDKVPTPNAGSGQLSNIMNNAVFPVAGALSILFIIIGAIIYIKSNGDPKQVNLGKETVIYAVIGLVVTIMSFAIVQLILGRFQ